MEFLPIAVGVLMKALIIRRLGYSAQKGLYMENHGQYPLSMCATATNSLLGVSVDTLWNVCYRKILPLYVGWLLPATSNRNERTSCSINVQRNWISSIPTLMAQSYVCPFCFQVLVSLFQIPCPFNMLPIARWLSSLTRSGDNSASFLHSFSKVTYLRVFTFNWIQSKELFDNRFAQSYPYVITASAGLQTDLTRCHAQPCGLRAFWC